MDIGTWASLIHVKIAEYAVLVGVAKGKVFMYWAKAPPALVQVQAWIAIVTNCFLFGFTSDQLMVYAPHLFRTRFLPVNGINKVCCCYCAASIQLLSTGVHHLLTNCEFAFDLHGPQPHCEHC
jgi:hypothetical protein